MKGDTILIESRFHGPPESGNGGYVCGRLAQFIDGPAAVVRLHVPPPLDTELQLRCSEVGVALFDNNVLVAEARRARVALEPPASLATKKLRRRRGGFGGLGLIVFRPASCAARTVIRAMGSASSPG